MASKKNRKKKWKALFARSKIVAFFVAVASYIYNKAEGSLAGMLLTSYDEYAGENSFLCGLIGKLNAGKRFFRPVKRTVSRLVSQSILIEKINTFIFGWIYTKLHVYGLFFITAGVGALLIQMLKVYGMRIATLSFLDVFVSCLLIILSFPLMLSHSSLNEAVCGSRIAGSVVFDWLGGKKEVFEKKTDQKGHSRIALPAGVVFCVFAWWARPIEILIWGIAAVLAVAVLYIPETGIVCLMFLFPFVSVEKLCVVLIYIAVCFFAKYIRGKRTVKFDAFATAVLAFSLLFLPGSPNGKEWFFGVCAFYLVVNLIKSKKWIERCVASLILSFLAVSLYGGASYLSYRFGIDYLIYVLKVGSNGAMTSFFENGIGFASYIVMVLPIVAMYSKKGKGFFSLLSFALGVVCLFFTYEYRAWLGLFAGFIVFFVLYGKKTLALMSGGLILLPFVLVNLPKEFYEKLSYTRVTGYLSETFFGNIYGYFTVLSVLAAVLFVFAMFLCLQKNITLYSKGCSQEGRTVSLGAMAGMAGFLTMGTDIVVYADFKCGLIFCLMMGLASCVSGTERNVTAFNEWDNFEYSEGDLF